MLISNKFFQKLEKNKKKKQNSTHKFEFFLKLLIQFSFIRFTVILVRTHKRHQSVDSSEYFSETLKTLACNTIQNVQLMNANLTRILRMIYKYFCKILQNMSTEASNILLTRYIKIGAVVTLYWYVMNTDSS